jgi:hypothetical protein
MPRFHSLKERIKQTLNAITQPPSTLGILPRHTPTPVHNSHQQPYQEPNRPPVLSTRQTTIKRRKNGTFVKKMQPEELRELCELIKERHGLDLQLWSLKSARRADQHLVEIKMHKADAMLRKIETIVKTFDHREAFSSQEEYAKFLDIKRRVLMTGKRYWCRPGNAPWDDK